MSGGQIGGAIVGGILGSFVGNPWLGAQIGMGTGGYLDPPDGPTVEGPRLDDARYQSSSYGVFQSRSYATITVSGNIFWLENDEYKHVETKTKSGGKGGGSKTTNISHSYFATFALSLDDTRSKGAPLVGIRRIWLGGQLWYDAGSSDPDTIAASNAAAAGFVFYPGSDTQSPDPRMQATLGVANTSGWPGLAYLVFYDLPLADYQNTLAGVQAKVELMQAGSITYAGVGDSSVSVPSSEYTCRPKWDGSQWVFVGQFPGNVMTSADGVSFILRSVLTAYSWSDIEYNGSMYMAVSGTINPNRVATSYDLVNWTYYTYGASAGWQWIVFGPGGKFLIVGYTIARLTLDYVAAPVTTTHGINNSGDPVWNGSVVCLVGTIGGVPYTVTSADGSTWATPIALPAGLTEAPDGVCTNGTALLVLGWSNTFPAVGKVSISNDNGASWSVWADLPYLPPGAKWCSPSFGNGVYCISSDSSREWATSVDGVNWDLHVGTTGGALFRRGIGTNGTEFARVSDDTSAGASWFTLLSFSAETTVTADPVPLADIVSAECLQSASLSPSDIDVSALTPLVSGYRVSRLGPIRSSLEVLRDSWPFDIRMNGYQIQAVMRGGTSVATIPAADLDARVEGAEPGVQITLPREMDSQLPRVLWVNHIDGTREYEPGAQYAERLNSAAVNVVSIELPIVMTPTEAAGKAQVLMGVKWLERYDVVFNLPPTYRRLQPADVVDLTAPDGVLSVRLTRINNTSDGRVECAGKLANATVYTPTAIGEPGRSTGVATIPVAGPSVYHLLDIPLLHDAQASAGFPVAMTGTKSGWRGGVVMQSADAGSTWAQIVEFSPPGSTFGAATNALGAVESRLLDTASRLTVVLTSGELFDVTELAMLGGANHFAYGADGRWEIIAATTCALQSGSTYILSGLLRGRYGSEQYMASHLAGDAIVLLDVDDLGIIAMASSTIGAARDYRGISVGADISSDSNRSFTYRAINLTPLSPIALTGHRDPSSGDWTLTWVRRTRTGGEWRDYVDAELGETVEQYQIDIFSDGTYTTVKRTLTVTAPGAAYPSADQSADFGSDQATLYLRIYQMSSAVGRGYPLTATITR